VISDAGSERSRIRFARRIIPASCARQEESYDAPGAPRRQCSSKSRFS
jgi:hypothetical protein